MVQKDHSPLFVSKERKRMHQEEIDIKMHQNSDAILVD